MNQVGYGNKQAQFGNSAVSAEVARTPVLQGLMNDVHSILDSLDERVNGIQRAMVRLQSKPVSLNDQKSHETAPCPVLDAPLASRFQYAFERASRVLGQLDAVERDLNTLV